MKKPTLIYKARQVITIFMVCICLITIVVVSACRLPASIETPTMGKEDIIQEYITYLSEAGDSTKTKRDNAVNIEYPGMETEASALPSQVDSATIHADHYASVAKQQHDLVIAQFGPDAWENVTYTLDEIDPVDGTLGYRVISTGELISETEYNRLFRDYWDNIAEQEGVTFYDLFLADGEPPEMMKNKRVDILTKYFDGMPVELTTISDAQTYRVNLIFNGERVSNQKYENFHFIIDNRKDKWIVVQGLTWAELYEFPEGD